MKWTPIPNLPKQFTFIYIFIYILTKRGDARLLILVTRYETIKGESSIYFRTVLYSFTLSMDIMVTNE